MAKIFTIPYPPTKAGKRQWAKEYGLNAYYAGKHWARRKQDAEYWHTLVRCELRRQGVSGMFDCPVTVSFHWNDGLDIDNHASMGKMIVDSLKGVLIKDDTRRYLVGVSHHFHEENFIGVVIRDA